MEGMNQFVSLMLLLTGAYTFLLGDDEVCYERLGCFSSGPPFRSPERLISVLPWSPDQLRTTYILYTRERRPEPKTLDARYPETIRSVWPSFRPRPTKFIIHGFLETVTSASWMQEMGGELLRYADFNVVVVDYSGGNQFPIPQAVANSRVVGAQVALLVNYLIEMRVLAAGDVHIIGQSLGAHIAGYAGERIAGLGRISALDAGALYFKDTVPRVRLDKTDAMFVDAIHTDIEIISLLGLGTPTPSGHADFFPNGGHDQPGCVTSLLPLISENGLLEGATEFLGCSHMRAIRYFNESINSPCPFWAFPCASDEQFEANLCQSCGDVGCSRMGFHADKYKLPQGQTVKYFLETAPQAPFCQYLYTVIVTFSTGPWRSVSGSASIRLSGDEFKSSWVSLNEGEARTFAPGQTSRFHADLPQDVGNVIAVSFKWQKLLSLGTLFGTPSVSIESITVYDQEAGDRFQFCGNGRSVESGSSITLFQTC